MSKTLTKANGASSVLSDFFEPWSEWFQNGFAGKSLTIPAVNISENKKEYNFSLTVPGLKKNDFNIDIDGDMLTISAENEKNSEEKKEYYKRTEYNYSSFSPLLTHPSEISMGDIEATYTMQMAFLS